MNEPLIGLLILALLLALEGLLAISRSALVHSRPGELQRLEEEGVSGSRRASRLASETTRFLLAMRLALGLIRLVVIGASIATFGSLAGEGLNIWVYVGILIGTGIVMSSVEFIGENIGMRRPERIVSRLSPFITPVVAGLAPLADFVQRVAGGVIGGQNGALHPMVTEEEIMTLVDAGEEGGLIEQDEKAMIYSIFQLDDTLAREVMIPRIDMLAFEEGTALTEATDVLLKTGYSRAPVYRESVDHVVGLVYAKDLLGAWREEDLDGAVGDLMRDAYFVPEAKKADDLLEDLQARRIHMAVVVDEYGGTAGLVTIEDIVEEIIGEIRDEYDFAEEARYRRDEEGVYSFSGGIDLDDVNQITGSELPKDDSDTLGGFIYGTLGRVPSPGDSLDAGGLHLEVEQVVRRRIRRVKATVAEAEETPSVDANAA